MSNWPQKELGEIAIIGAGNAAPQKKKDFENGKYPFFRTSDVGKVKISNSLRKANDYLNEQATTKMKQYPKGTILLPKSGASTFLNHRVIMEVDGYVSSHLAAIKVKKRIANEKFVFYFLQTVKAQDLIQDHKYPSLKLSTISKIQIPLPPLPEQKRIVAFLDEIFEKLEKAKANAEKNLKNSKELFDASLANIFSNKDEDWKELTLKDVSIQFGRGKSKHRPRNDKKLFDGKYPFIQTGDVRNSKHKIKNFSQTYNEIGLEQSKLWPKGTVCITIAANIAETAILDFDACFPDSIIGLIPNPKITTSDFVEYLLTFYSKMLKGKGKGSAQANINMGTFENEYFLFPTLKDQKKIVVKLNDLYTEVKKLGSLYTKKLSQLDELKQSILHQAFSGKL